MKKLFLLLIITIFNFTFTSCDNAGVTKTTLNGDEQNLPKELKGLKIYDVSIGGLDYVKVAVLNNKPISTTYTVGKTQETTIIINKPDYRIINAKSIISENDSIIVIKKH